jgi:hypothetical protein
LVTAGVPLMLDFWRMEPGPAAVVAAGIAMLGAVVAAIVASWSAIRAERSKAAAQGLLEEQRLENDNAKYANETHFRTEYELYERIYPQLLDAGYEFKKTKSMKADPEYFEQFPLSEPERTPQKIAALREAKLDEALRHLSNVLEPVERRKPFICRRVYTEVHEFFRMGLDTYLARRYPTLFADKAVATEAQLQEQVDKIGECIRVQLRVRDVVDHTHERSQERDA